MNQINKILSGLKKRRVSTPAEDASIGAMPAAKISRQVVLKAVAAVAVVVVVAGGAWWAIKHKAVAPAKVAQAPSRPVPVQQPPAPVQQPEPQPIHEQATESEGGVTQAASGAVAVVAQAALPMEGEGDKKNAPKEGAGESVAPRKSGGAKEAKGNGSPEELKQSMPQESVAHGTVTEDAVVSAVKPEGKGIVADVGQVEAVPPAPAKPRPRASAGKAKHAKTAPPPAMAVAEDQQPAEPKAEPPLPGGVDKQVKPLGLQEQANNEFIKANDLLQRGSLKEALAGYETVLHLDPGYESARQAMVAILLQGKRNADAERVLQEGLKQNIKNSGFAMLLARIQFDRDAPWSALLTLQKTLPYAAEQADYQAFVAALLQRLNRHKEAVAHYQAALELAPDSGVWWMGMGISLKALQRAEESRIAFRRALESRTLSADLQDFVNRQLKDL